MFQWFMQALDGRVVDFLEEYIEQILFENFNEPIFLEAKLELVERKLETLKMSEWDFMDYYLEKWLLRKLVILKQISEKPEVIQKFIQENLIYPAIRKKYVADLIEKEQYIETIDVLKDGKKINSDSPDLVSDYSKELKELYQLTGNTESYLQELWLLVLDYEYGELEYYRELKAMYSQEDWLTEREKVFAKDESGIEKLYKEEQLYDRLLESVSATGQLYKLNQYEAVLKEHYPKELLNQYAKLVKQEVKMTGKRNHYQELVSILRKMKTYPSGFLLVADITAEWQVIYKNRPAMMDELKKL
jgi:hypothetical protein